MPALKLNFDQAVSALKKSWKAYRIAGRNGEPRGDIAWRINRLQSSMGLEKSQLEGMSDNEDQELIAEELQAQKGECGGEWEPNLNSGTSEEKSELYTEEWSEEDKELLREE